jgi:uncharacterized membrane protein YccC
VKYKWDAFKDAQLERNHMSFVASLKRTRDKSLALRADPWQLRLQRARGKLGDDGIERVSTQSLFDMLEVRQGNRTADACRRLSKLMHELGWHPIKARGITPGGFRDQVRGYARDTTRQALVL